MGDEDAEATRNDERTNRKEVQDGQGRAASRYASRVRREKEVEVVEAGDAPKIGLLWEEVHVQG